MQPNQQAFEWPYVQNVVQQPLRSLFSCRRGVILICLNLNSNKVNPTLIIEGRELNNQKTITREKTHFTVLHGDGRWYLLKKDIPLLQT